MAPIVHAKLLGILAVKFIPGPDPLHVLAVVLLVIVGNGFTVIVKEAVAPIPQVLFPLTVMSPEIAEVE